MIAEAIQKILDISAVDPLLVLTDGSGRQYLWNDNTHKYEEIDRIVFQNETVSSLCSLTDIVIEEANRRNNPTGEFMTVRFTADGGFFSPDDRVRRDRVAYTRRQSHQLNTLINGVGRPMTHVEFVRFLQSLRPSIHSYATVLAQFRKVTFDSTVIATSNPTLVDGKAGASLAFNLQIGGATRETTLPSTIGFEMCFDRANHYSVDFIAEVDATVHEQSKSIRFSLLVPDLQAHLDEWTRREIADFLEGLKEAGLSRVLVLSDI